MYQRLMEDVSTLEQERSSMLETMLEKDTEIAELSAEILKLEIEKEFISQESKGTAESLEQSYRDLKKANKMVVKLKQQERRHLSAGNYGAGVSESDVLKAKDKFIASLFDRLTKSEERARILEDQQRAREVDVEHQGLDATSNELAELKTTDLRTCNFPELEKKAASALAEVTLLRSKLKSKDLELSHSTKSYESRIRDLESKLQDRALNANERSLESHGLVDELARKVDELKTAAKQGRLTIRNQERQLKEVVADNALLSQKLESLAVGHKSKVSQKGICPPCHTRVVEHVASLEKSLRKKSDGLSGRIHPWKVLHSKHKEKDLDVYQLQRRYEGLQRQLADQNGLRREDCSNNRKVGCSSRRESLECTVTDLGKENDGQKVNVITPPTTTKHLRRSGIRAPRTYAASRQQSLPAT